MTATAHKTPQALDDLFDLASYIAERNLDAGVRFLEAAERTTNQLARMPGIGSLWQSRKKHLAGLRVSQVPGFRRYLIFYRPLDDGIEVVRVLHSARDLESLL